RISLLSKLDETIIAGEEKFELGSNQYRNAIHPQGCNYLTSFTRNIFPEWIYRLPKGITIKKTIAAVNGENTTLVIYKVIKAQHPFSMEWLPLVSFRDFHALTNSNETIDRNASFENDIWKVKAYKDAPELFISIPGASFTPQPDWYFNFEYAVEKYRGLDFTEDLFTHGKFNTALEEGDQLGIIISTANPHERDALQLFRKEAARREKIIRDKKYNHPVLKTLALAGDQFIVNRGEELKTIIAGYHWFSDWGRDTMIALPGLCLSTGRFEDAKKILSAFAKSVSEGMLPNRFPDYGEAPEYNTIDATLWFFIAVHQYLQQSGDEDFVKNELLPVLKDIIDWHFKGTRYNIHVTEDGLLSGGAPGQQLTWMDARVGDWVVTPRSGKAVEINALWYNALMVYADLLSINGESAKAREFTLHAKKTRASFAVTFWNEYKNCLYDCVDGNHKDDAIRPNQLFAISLPFPLLTGKKAENILKIVTEKLYTPYGLRSLSADHPDYKPLYGGDQFHRDDAYHQGTVWSWLLGPYVDAIMKVTGSKTKAKQIIGDFVPQFNAGCIGSISEIMDATPPFKSRGCVAQAWSVGELLRVCLQYNLLDSEKKKITGRKSKKAVLSLLPE
ncbi:MAG TPA: amylo-alpha-1,6-glucosidase, partial [Chitinophagales bacterium]|nr:amylo-alpha-1,6-glucosidase [Chitinophagales bacterium]